MLAGLVWIEADRNPSGLRVLDCRSITLGATDLTGDPQIARSFGRATDGKEYQGHLPRNASRADCELRYPFPGQGTQGAVFLADSMEDKWDIYLYDSCLYFARSWSKELLFRASLEVTTLEFIVRSIDATDEGEFDDTGLAVRQVDFLIKSHLYKVPVPHPLPRGFPQDTEKIATYSMSMFGRWAAFATYGDTTQIKVDWRPPNA